MLFLMTAYVVFIAVILGVIIPNFSEAVLYTMLTSPWFLVFQQVMVLIFPLGLWLFLRREKLTLPNAKLGGTNIILIIFLCVFLQPLMMLLSGIMSMFFANPVGDVVNTMMEQPMWLLILAIAVTPAICEELVFRGYIQSAYKNRSFKKAALINGLFFGIIHMNMQQFPYAFAMGIIFAYMVHYTRSIRAGILAHFLINASQITLAVAVSRYVAEINNAAEVPDVLPGALDAYGLYAPAEYLTRLEQLTALVSVGFIALMATPFVIILFRVFISHNRQRNIKADMEQALGAELTEPAAEELLETNQEPQGMKFRLLKHIDPFMIAVVIVFILLL